MTAPQYVLTGRRESGALAELLDATREGERVVIKLFQALSSDFAYARSIAETSRALAVVAHPGIVRDVDVGVVRKRLAVVRPAVGGVTLGDALRKLNTRDVILPTALALLWVIELLDVVQKAHEAGVVHGGITPGNVLITPSGQLRVCDFGAMRALLAVPALKKSMLGSGRGGYRAPEVALGEEPSPAADIYSLGALLYELLTLREPGGDKEPGSGRGPGMHTRRGQMTTPSRIDRRLNARIDPVVMRALEASTNRRYRTAAEFQASLRGFLAESGGVPSAAEVERVVAELVNAPSPVGAPPFTEPFTLEPIEGGELGGVAERTMVFEERPAFSGGQVKPDEFPEDAATTEAPPAFEEYREDATKLGRAGRPQQLPTFEDTEPSRAGPLEVGWVAPPGEAPRRKAAGAGDREKSVVRPRVKVIEDFSVIEPAPELSVSVSVSGAGRRREANREPSLSRSPPRRYEPEPRHDTDDPPGPPPEPSVSGTPRPLRTEERKILAAARKNRRFLLAVSGLSLLGALCFGLAIWQLNARRAKAPPAILDHSPAIPLPVAKPVVAPPAPVKKAAPPAPEATPVKWDEPPPRRQAGFLNVTANVPAYVYVDGARVRQHTPLRHYRVRPGHRTIALEAISTGDRHEFTVVIVRGRQRTIQEPDLKGRPR